MSGIMLGCSFPDLLQSESSNQGPIMECAVVFKIHAKSMSPKIGIRAKSYRVSNSNDIEKCTPKFSDVKFQRHRKVYTKILRCQNHENLNRIKQDFVQSGLHHTCTYKLSSNSGSNKRTQRGRTTVRPILEKYCVALMRCDRSAVSLRVFCPKGQVGATLKRKNQLPLETGHWGTLL